ncbi:MFS transporter [Thermocrinis sp.]|uniref:MFS transporter n=1 Tax=Thermocrinis sp. TaxID=2024383 RepID=UPI002FDDA7ED
MKKLLSFALFDSGETILGALIFSTFYPLYITQHIDPKLYSFFYGFAFFLSFFVALPLAKVADKRAFRKHFFILFSILTVLFGVLLSLTVPYPRGNLFIYLLMVVFHQQTMVFYNSLLAGLPQKGFASGFGVAFGYLGSSVSLIFLASWLKVPEVFYQASFIFFILALPAIANLPNPPSRKAVSIKEVTSDRKFLLLILSILSLTEVANTLIAMMGVYLKNAYMLEAKEIYRVIGLSALGGVLGGIIFGRLTDKLGAKTLFPLAFLLWPCFLVLLFFIPKDFVLILGLLGGLSLSHLWTTSRVLLIESFPAEEVSVRMSFLSLTERIASTTGLWTWSLFMLLTQNNYKLSALLMIVFPTLGFLLYWFSKR